MVDHLVGCKEGAYKKNNNGRVNAFLKKEGYNRRNECCDKGHHDSGYFIV